MVGRPGSARPATFRSPLRSDANAGRVALVTGGGTGLGRATAAELARSGASVVVCGRREEPLAAARAEMEAAGADCLAVAADVREEGEVERVVDAAIARFGHVDVLVNNAGIAPRYPDPQSVTEQLWDKVISVNLKGPFRLTALVGARMVAGDGGSIVNISSIGSVRPTHDILPYAAAKAGLNALTIGFADALGPKVRVNAVMPGPFLTDISREWNHDAFAERARTFPLRRAGTPGELASAILYFASDASSFTTGSLLAVDGGAQWSLAGGGDQSEAYGGSLYDGKRDWT
jgi:NAD(P)-dependent dehydrogenase (short-subunit alcohol dehydrogenase family)